MENETLHHELEQLNDKIKEDTPGYYVRCNDSGKLEYELVGPDGNVHYRRDRLCAIAAVALGRTRERQRRLSGGKR